MAVVRGPATRPGHADGGPGAPRPYSPQDGTGSWTARGPGGCEGGHGDDGHTAPRRPALAALSSGERQLAFIARALAQQPRLLFLDEPTSHLDITHQIALLDLMAKLNREKGLTVVMILHDLNLASHYCHRLLLLDKGRLHAEGPPDDVLTPETIRQVYGASVAVLNGPSSRSR